MIDTDMHGLSSIPDGARRPRHSAAMWFDGVDDYIDCGNSSALNISGSFSFCVKAFRFIEKIGDGLLVKGNNGSWTTNAFGFRTSTYTALATFVVYLDASSTRRLLSAAYAFPSKTWMSLVAIISVSFPTLTIQVYNDNVIVATATVSTAVSLATTTLPLIIGRGYTPYFSGVITRVGIYNHALTFSERAAWQQNQPIDGVLAQYDGNGNTADAWRDLSGNGYHGTVYGSPEQCLIHQRGAVIRTDANQQRYIVT